MDNPSLLPNNQTSLEQLVSQTLSSSADLGSGELIRSLWNAETCLADLLTYLAQAVAVDQWDHRWPEQQKRDVIAHALEIHRLKGTPIALLKALESHGITASLREWWQPHDPDYWLPPTDVKPGTIVVQTLLNDNQGVNKSKLQQMDNAISHAKRESIHIAVELGLKWDESLALSLAATPGIMTSDHDAQITPLHPESGETELNIAGSTNAITLADHDTELMPLHPQPTLAEFALGGSTHATVLADFDLSGEIT